MQLEKAKRIELIVVVLVMFGIYAFTWYSASEVRQEFANDPVYQLVKKVVRPALLLIGALIFLQSFVAIRRLQSIDRTQKWLIDVVRYQGGKIGAFCPYENQEPIANTAVSRQPLIWPWGQHHTEYLGHLEAAARKWWTLYDPSDPTTAPTNDMVSEWLQNERGISKEKAKAIASMLRPDGLPTGPRR